MPKIILINPPFIPSDQALPAGLGVISKCLNENSIAHVLWDANKDFFNYIEGQADTISPLTLVGDHSKSTNLVKDAREAYLSNTPNHCSTEYTHPFHLQPSFCVPYSLKELNSIGEFLCESKYWERVLFQKLNAFIDDCPNPIIAISVMGPYQVLFAHAIAIYSKRKSSKCYIVVGGTHFSFLLSTFQSALGKQLMFDRYFIGYSEHEFVDFCMDSIRGSKKSQPLDISDGFNQKILTPYFSPEILTNYNLHHVSYPVLLSPGCRYGKCPFCTYKLTGPYRDFMPEHAVEAFRSAATLGFKSVSFKDSGFAPDQLKIIGNANLSFKLRWSACFSPAYKLSLYDISTLRHQGLHTIELGVDSIIHETQSNINKLYSPGEVERLIADLCSSGVYVVVNLIYGFPWEKENDAITQIDWFQKMQNTYGDLIHGSHNIMEVNVGSSFARQPEKFDIDLYPRAPFAFTYDYKHADYLTHFWHEKFKFII